MHSVVCNVRGLIFNDVPDDESGHIYAAIAYGNKVQVRDIEPTLLVEISNTPFKKSHE